LRAAERLAKAGRSEDARASFEKAQQGLEGVSKGLDEKLKNTFERGAQQLAETHAALVEQCVDLPPLRSLSPTVMAPEAGPAGEERFARGDVSFVKQVAPLLVAKCGRCHVDGGKGGFSLASYNALMRGSAEGGRVLVPGEGTGGVMMDLIESGDMPRGGLTVSPQEMTLLSRWITQGARFDGADPNANLKQLTPGNAPAPQTDPPMQELTPAKPTGKETVSFALDLAPILSERCANCHVLNNRGNLQFANFQQLLGAGVVKPGKPDESALVRRLRGDEMPRMPQNGAPLSDAQIAKFATWVREGARFDGERPRDTLQRTTALVRADRATSEELNAIRAEQTQQNWRLALPDEQDNRVQTPRFLVVGAVPEALLSRVAKLADEGAEQAIRLFGGKPGGPLGKSRFTLFVFDDRIDYGEFGLMVENRSPPRGQQGHARHDPVDPYACLLVDADSEQLDKALITQQVASLYLSERSKGRAPDWFASGAGSIAAVEGAADSPLAESLAEGFESSYRRMKKPDDFMSGAMSPDAATVVSYQFVEALRRNKRGFAKLIESLDEGADFDAAFKKQYQASPQELAQKWWESLKR
jgi:mono/diheme cytochrome c family protein